MEHDCFVLGTFCCETLECLGPGYSEIGKCLVIHTVSYKLTGEWPYGPHRSAEMAVSNVVVLTFFSILLGFEIVCLQGCHHAVLPHHSRQGCHHMIIRSYTPSFPTLQL
jgi:hypothetical protein